MTPDPEVCWNCEKGFHEHCHGMAYRWHPTGRTVGGYMPEYVQSKAECACETCKETKLW